jgi:dienelactone hydrolase
MKAPLRLPPLLPSPVTRRRCVLGAAAGLLAAQLPLRARASEAAASATGTGAAAAFTLAGDAIDTTPFETLDLDWLDSARARPVPVRLYRPIMARAGRTPLVVLSHGIGGSRRGYSWLGQHFASQGVASLHLQHVGSDRDLWFGNVLGLVGRLQAAAQEAEALARVQDLRFALDTLLAGPLAVHIDASRIVAAGHSYGANTALLACGARVERQGKLLDLQDSRLRGAIVMSAPPFYGQAQPAKILGAVQLPTLHVTATEDVIRIPGYFSGAEDRVAVFDATGGARKWLAVYEGGSHSMFTDRSGTGGVALNPKVKTATRALATAFLRGVFDSDDTHLARWPQQHSDILARFVAPRA